MESWPYEVMENLLCYISFNDVKNLSSTNSELRRKLKERMFHTIRIPERKKLVDDDYCDEKLNQVSNILPYCEVLKLFTLDGSICEVIARSGNLKKLKIFNGAQLDSASLHTLCNGLKYLNTLELHFIEVSNIGLFYLKNLLYLQKLVFSQCNINDEGLSQIARVPTVTNLAITDNKDEAVVTEKGIRALVAMTSLEKLNLLWLKFKGVADDCFKHIYKLTQLKALNLSYCNMSDGVLPLISTLGLLEQLFLNEFHLVYNENLQHLSKLTSLKRLSLRRCLNLSDEGMVCLCKIEQLEDLDISCCYKVTERGFQCLTRLSKLKALHVNSSSINNQGVAHLTHLKYLKELHVSECNNLTDDCLPYIRSMSALKRINIDLYLNKSVMLN